MNWGVFFVQIWIKNLILDIFSRSGSNFAISPVLKSTNEISQLIFGLSRDFLGQVYIFLYLFYVFLIFFIIIIRVYFMVIFWVRGVFFLIEKKLGVTNTLICKINEILLRKGSYGNLKRSLNINKLNKAPTNKRQFLYFFLKHQSFFPKQTDNNGH